MRLLFILLLTAALARAGLAPIAIQPMGTVKRERLDVVRKALEHAFGVKVEILEAKALPKEAWYEPRER